MNGNEGKRQKARKENPIPRSRRNSAVQDEEQDRNPDETDPLLLADAAGELSETKARVDSLFECGLVCFLHFVSPIDVVLCGVPGRQVQGGVRRIAEPSRGLSSISVFQHLSRRPDTRLCHVLQMMMYLGTRFWYW